MFAYLPTTGVHDDRRSEPRWFDAPSSLNTERISSIFGAAVATTEDESGRFSLVLICVQQHVQEKRFKNDDEELDTCFCFTCRMFCAC